MNRISAWADARRNLNNSISILNLPSITYTQGVILIISSTGEFASKNLMNSISCGTPDISVIFTILSFSKVQPLGHSLIQKSKSGASIATNVFEEPYMAIKDEKGFAVISNKQHMIQWIRKLTASPKTTKQHVNMPKKTDRNLKFLQVGRVCDQAKNNKYLFHIFKTNLI